MVLSRCSQIVRRDSDLARELRRGRRPAEPRRQLAPDLGSRMLASWRRRGTRTGLARSRICRLISPATVGTAKATNSSPRFGLKRSMAFRSPIEPACTRSSCSAPRLSCLSGQRFDQRHVELDQALAGTRVALIPVGAEEPAGGRVAVATCLPSRWHTRWDGGLRLTMHLNPIPKFLPRADAHVEGWDCGHGRDLGPSSGNADEGRLAVPARSSRKADRRARIG